MDLARMCLMTVLIQQDIPTEQGLKLLSKIRKGCL